MERISAGRALMGDSLGFHLLLIIFGVALPLLISGLEFYGLVTHRPRARALAHSWSRGLVVLFVAGAVSGTIVSFQFSLLWPTFMKFVSKPVGLAFALEGTAFMVEAVFLSVYMLSWNRFKPWLHWLVGVPVWLGSVTSAIFITSVNAFMNQPVGFVLGPDGQPTNINVAKAIFNPAMIPEVTHSVIAYLCAASMFLAAIYAWLYMKRRHAADRPWIAQVLVGLMIVGLITAGITGFTGDRAARYLADHEPYKLAAAEGLLVTQTHAPLLIGGVVHGDQISGAIKIPSLLSFLAKRNFGAEVKGLDTFPVADRPSLVVHYFFDGMVLSGILLIVIPSLFLFLRVVRRRWAFSKPMLAFVVLCGGLGIIATEFGWLLTELGRQPYVIYGYLRTADALIADVRVVRLGFIFPTFFIILLTLTVIVLRKTMNHKAVHDVHA